MRRKMPKAAPEPKPLPTPLPWEGEWDSCDCGDGYGCSHPPGLYRVTHKEIIGGKLKKTVVAEEIYVPNPADAVLMLNGRQTFEALVALNDLVNRRRLDGPAVMQQVAAAIKASSGNLYDCIYPSSKKQEKQEDDYIKWSLERDGRKDSEEYKEWYATLETLLEKPPRSWEIFDQFQNCKTPEQVAKELITFKGYAPKKAPVNHE